MTMLYGLDNSERFSDAQLVACDRCDIMIETELYEQKEGTYICGDCVNASLDATSEILFAASPHEQTDDMNPDTLNPNNEHRHFERFLAWRVVKRRLGCTCVREYAQACYAFDPPETVLPGRQPRQRSCRCLCHYRGDFERG